MLKPSAETLWARRILGADPRFAQILFVAAPGPAKNSGAGHGGGEILAFTPGGSPARPSHTETMNNGHGEASMEAAVEGPKGSSPSRIA